MRCYFCALYMLSMQRPAEGQIPTPSAPCDMSALSRAPEGLIVWSPDGTRYAVSKTDASGIYQIYIGSAMNSTVKCISCTQRPGGPAVDRHKMQPQWHPSGQWLFAAVEREEFSPPPVFASDPSYILGQLQDGLWTNMWAVSPDGEQWYQLTNFASGVSGTADGYTGPAMTPDGKHGVWSQIINGDILVYYPFGRWQLILADFDVTNGVPSFTNLQDITPAGMYWNEPGSFSPDNQSLVLTGSIQQDAEGMDQYILNIATGLLTDLTNSPSIWDEHGVFSPDGQKILFMSSYPYRSDPSSGKILSLKTEFMLMDADGSNLTQLTHFYEAGYPEYSNGDAAVGAWSSNGKTLSLLQLFFPAYETWNMTFVGSCGGQSPTPALEFYPLAACRIADTRSVGGGALTGAFGPPSLVAEAIRAFPITSSDCNVPATAQAYSLNFTVVPPGPMDYLTTWPSGHAQPTVSTLNDLGGAVLANAALVPAGLDGSIDVFTSDPTDLIIDINGYFAPPGGPLALGFYPLTPCRIMDTRNPTGLLGGPQMTAQETRSFPVQSGACDIPSSAQAYSLNMTVVPPGPLFYLTTWATGQTQPPVSTLNDLGGNATANAALVPAGTGGSVEVFVSDPSNLIIDINGYFAVPGSSGALNFYPLTPCRIADTRVTPIGTFSGPTLRAGETRSFPIPASACSVPSTAQAYSLNLTVSPGGPVNYVTTWATGQPQPLVSTLNDLSGAILANAAIVPAGIAGAIDVFTTDPTDLIIDINGYFAP